MSDIFREVDEAMQREKAAQFWKTYGPTLVLAAIILVLATGATTAYRSWDSWRNQQETQRLLLAAEDKDIAGAMEKAAANTRKGHEAIALMNAASRYANDKNFTKAAALYDSVSKDSSVPDDLQDLSAILYARAAMLTTAAAKPDFKTLASRLEPVAVKDKSAFQLLAKLDAALLYGDGLKDYTKALTFLEGFDGKYVPESLKEKASALKHVYQYELSAQPAKQ